MNDTWILCTLVYALLKGSREGMKKAALKKNSSNEILFFYTFIGFLFTLPYLKSALQLPPFHIFLVFIKSAVVCTAWIFAFEALKNMPVSMYGIMDLSRMIFSTLLGVFILGEPMTKAKLVGIFLVTTGLILANAKRTSETKQISAFILFAALMNCFFNAISGTMDKILMQQMESSQLQFWFMLFLTLLYGIILCIKKERVSIKTVKSNFWIPLLSLSLIIGDKFLFEANRSPYSQVTVMMVIKQSSLFVTILTGWLVFHEKHILYKTFCALIVLSGILIAVLL